MFCQQFLDYYQKIVDKTSNVERIQAVPNDTALLPVLIKYCFTDKGDNKYIPHVSHPYLHDYLD